MKSDSSANSKSNSSKTTTGQALTTPTKQPAKKSAPNVPIAVSSSPDSDDSSNSVESSPVIEKTGEIQTATPDTSTNAVVVVASSPSVRPISMSESMEHHYLYYDGKETPPVHRSVSFTSKKTKEKVLRYVLSVDLMNKDQKIVTLDIWEDRLKTIPFFERWFRY